jgi:hypothetical protein
VPRREEASEGTGTLSVRSEEESGLAGCSVLSMGGGGADMEERASSSDKAMESPRKHNRRPGKMIGNADWPEYK